MRKSRRENGLREKIKFDIEGFLTHYVFDMKNLLANFFRWIGLQGPQGDMGPPGPQGPTGPSGSPDVATRRSVEGTFQPDDKTIPETRIVLEMANPQSDEQGHATGLSIVSNMAERGKSYANHYH